MASILSILLLLGLVLVKGGAVDLAALTWTGVCLLLLAVMVACSFKKVRSIDGNPVLSAPLSISPALKLLLLLQFWLVIQCLFGIARDQTALLDDLLLGLGFCAFLFIINHLSWRRREIKYFLYGLFLLAVCQAIYGLWVFLSQTNMILWMEKLHYLDKPTGTLVNANHFAALLALLMVLLVSFLACRYQQQANKRNLFHLMELLYSPSAVLLLLLFVTIFATRSFGGIGSLLLTVLAALAVMTRQHFSKLQIVFVGGLFIVMSVLVLELSDYSVIQNEFKYLAFTIERRFEISTAAMRMVMDNWLLGVGAGGFYSSFSQYRDLSVGNSFYHFAHNDYLQFWAEYGLVGVMIGILFVAQCLRSNIRVLKHSRNVYKRTFAYASCYGTFLLAVHSLVDFPLQIPAYALLYLMIIYFNVIFDTTKHR